MKKERKKKRRKRWVHPDPTEIFGIFLLRPMSMVSI